MSSITVSLPGALRAKVGNRASVTIVGETVRDIIEALERDFPGLRFNLCYETGELRQYVHVFLNRVNIRYLQGLETPVSAGSIVHIFQAVAGG